LNVDFKAIFEMVKAPDSRSGNKAPKKIDGLCATTRNLKKFHALCMNHQRSFKSTIYVQTDLPKARPTLSVSRQLSYTFTEILPPLSQDAGPGASYEYVLSKGS
jgi:hypothetical protein